MSGCIKNGKKFLIFNFYGNHVYNTAKLGVFMPGVSNSFIVKEKCVLCGNERTRRMVEYNTLIHEGHTEKELQEALEIEIS